MAMTGFARFAACGLMAATLIVAGTSFVRAADDDEDVSFDKKIQNNIMSAIGLRGGPSIDYKERSPLVLPPKIDLPPPQNNAAASTPNWPVDADQKRKKEEVSRRRDEVEESRPLRPNELNVGDRYRSRTAGPTQDQRTASRASRRISGILAASWARCGARKMTKRWSSKASRRAPA
jgi:hypothetical protein